MSISNLSVSCRKVSDPAAKRGAERKAATYATRRYRSAAAPDVEYVRISNAKLHADVSLRDIEVGVR